MTSQDLKSRADALFGIRPKPKALSAIEQDAEAVQAKIARLKALREERQKAEAAEKRGRR